MQHQPKLFPGVLDSLQSSGFTHISLLADTSLPDEANEAITAAHGKGLEVILGPCEGEPVQDYIILTYGKRWKFHPEDQIQFPRSDTLVGIRSFDYAYPADAEASIFDPDTIINTCYIEGSSPGYVVDTLLIRPELLPDDSLILHCRLRLRLRDTMPDTSLGVVQVLVKDSGVVEADSIINVVVNGNSRKRTPSSDTLGVPLNSDDKYGEVYLGKWLHWNRPIVVKIKYLANTPVYIDYIAFDNSRADSLFRGSFDGSIDVRRGTYHSTAGLWALKAGDEPELPRWPLVGYIEQRHRLSAEQVRTMSYLMHTWRSEVLRYALETKHEQLAIDVYPILRFPGRDSLMNTNDPTGMEIAQSRFQCNLHDQSIDFLRCVSTVRRDDLKLTPPLWVQIQNHEDRPEGWDSHHETWYREPANDELLVQANLALAHGAAGVWHFPVGTNDTTDQGLALFRGNCYADSHVREINRYGENKWLGLRAVNAQLADMGPRLVGMRWRDAFSADSASSLQRMKDSLTCNGVATVLDLVTRSSSGIIDSAAARYCEVGVFDKNDASGKSEYFFAVNKRVGGDAKRTVCLLLRHSGNDLWIERVPGRRVDVVYDSTQWPVSYDIDTAFVTLAAGEGALMFIDSASSTRDRSITDTGVVHTGATLELKQGATLTIGRNAALVVKGTVLVDDSSSIILDGGTILFPDTLGKIVFQSNKNGLKGTGTIVDGHIEFSDSTNIAWGDTLVFRGNTRFSCSDAQTRMYIDGVQRFDVAGSMVEFADCITDIFVSGAFDVQHGVTLRHVPRVTGYSGSQMLSHGEDTSKTRWQFRSIGACNAYGLLDARHTVFEGRPDSNNVWTGILAAYEDAELHLDSCTVTDVQVENCAYSCAAVHLYGATNGQNRIHGTHIHRSEDGIGRVGYGVFLQPGHDEQGQQISSYVRIVCSEIDSGWWVGACAVSSDIEINTTRIAGNRVGMSVIAGSRGMLYGSCIEDATEGCGVHVAASEMYFGSALTQWPGYNRVAQNDSTQIAIDACGYVYFGIENNNAGNNVSHSDSTIRRVTMDPTAQQSHMQFNWWGAAPDTSSGLFTFAKSEAFFGLSSVPPGNLLYGPALDIAQLTSCMIACNEMDPLMQVFKKQMGLPAYATALWQLPLYAQAGNFHEVYRMLGQYVTQSTRWDAATQAASFALIMEGGHIRKFPDSTVSSFERLSGFLTAIDGVSQPQSVRAGLLSIRAQAAFLCGDVATAETHAAQLETMYAGSRAAYEIAIPRLLMTTMGGDSAAVNAKTEAILGAMHTDLQCSQARHVRNGYHRVLQRPFIRKARGEWKQESEQPPEPDGLNCTAYPNPFTASTIIAWTMRECDHVVVRLYDALGREVLRPTDTMLEIGRHTVELHRSDLPPGFYFVHVRTSTQHAVLRILLKPKSGSR